MENAAQSWRRNWLGGLILAALTVVAYLPVWHAGFIWDDDAYVTNSLPLRSWDGLRQIWFVPGATEQYYPLTITTFWIEYHLWQLAPLGYHLDNVVLHALNSLLLWIILRRLDAKGAWLAAAIFALHPVNVESVAWVTERKNTLSGFLYGCSILAALKFWQIGWTASDSSGTSLRQASDHPRKWIFYWLACGLYVGALLSKTAAAPLPLVLLLLLWWKRGRLGRKDLWPLGLLVLLGLLMGGITIWVEKHLVGTQGEVWDFSWTTRYLLAGRIFWFYLFKLLWPHPLMFVYPRWEIDPVQPLAWLFPLAAVAVLAVLVWYRHGSARPLFVALAYFTVLIFPVLGFFNLYFFRYSFVEDHLQYLAGIGPIALAAAGLTSILDLAAIKAPWVKPLLCGALLLSLGAVTARQCAIYADRETFFRAAVERNPDCWMAYSNLGFILINKGQVDEAAVDFQRSMQLHPDDGAANNVGMVFVQKGQLDAAEAYFRKALEFNPYYADADNNLGNVYLQKGQIDQALACFRRAVMLDPDSTKNHDNFASALVQRGWIDEAAAQYQKSLEIDSSDVRALEDLAWIRATSPESSLRQGARAVELASHANQLSGGNRPLALVGLAAAYAENGQYSVAMQTAQRALDLALAQGNAGEIQRIREQMQFYQNGAPFRDASLKNRP